MHRTLEWPLGGGRLVRFNLDRGDCTLSTKSRLRSHECRDLHQVRDDSGPAGLVAGAEPGSILAMKVLMELNKVPPVRIVLKLLHGSVHGAFSVWGAQEDIGEPLIDLDGDLKQRLHGPRTCRALDLKVVSVELIELIKRP